MAIHIKKKNVGKFTAYKKRTGKTTAEALHSKNPHVRQMANFARNAKKWHHEEGGYITPIEFGFGGVLQGIAPFLSLIPGAGAPLSMLANMAGGALESDEKQGLQDDLFEEQRKQKAYGVAKAGQASIMPNARPTFGKRGGYMYAIGGEVPVELEKDENGITPEGGMFQLNNEPSHEQGGKKGTLPPGSFVFPDDPKMIVPPGVKGLESYAGKTIAEAAAPLLKMRAKYEKILNS